MAGPERASVFSLPLDYLCGGGGEGRVRRGEKCLEIFTEMKGDGSIDFVFPFKLLWV